MLNLNTFIIVWSNWNIYVFSLYLYFNLTSLSYHMSGCLTVSTSLLYVILTYEYMTKMKSVSISLLYYSCSKATFTMTLCTSRAGICGLRSHKASYISENSSYFPCLYYRRVEAHFFVCIGASTFLKQQKMYQFCASQDELGAKTSPPPVGPLIYVNNIK